MKKATINEIFQLSEILNRGRKENWSTEKLFSELENFLPGKEISSIKDVDTYDHMFTQDNENFTTFFRKFPKTKDFPALSRRELIERVKILENELQSIHNGILRFETTFKNLISEIINELK